MSTEGGRSPPSQADERMAQYLATGEKTPLAEARKQLEAEESLLNEVLVPWTQMEKEIQEREATIEIALESIEKGFKEKMLHQQLWSITSALSDAVRDVPQDDEVKDKVAGVRTVVQEFQDWLEEQVGAAVSKEEGEGMTRAKRLTEGKGTEGEERQAAVVKEDHQDERLAQVQQTLEDLAARLEVVEKQHPGRQTDLGGNDAEPVQKNGKGYRGLPISI